MAPLTYTTAEDITTITATIKFPAGNDSSSFDKTLVESRITEEEIFIAYDGQTVIQGAPWGRLVAEDCLWQIESSSSSSSKTNPTTSSSPSSPSEDAGKEEKSENEKEKEKEKEKEGPSSTSTSVITVSIEKAVAGSWPLLVRGPVGWKKDAKKDEEEKKEGEEEEELGDDDVPDLLTSEDAEAEEAAAAEEEAEAKEASDAKKEEEIDGTDHRKPFPYPQDASIDAYSLYKLAELADRGGIPLFTKRQQLAMYAVSSDRGCTQAMFRLGLVYSDTNEISLAFKQAGVVITDENKAGAMKLLVTAADQDNLAALLHLGRCYVTGKGIPVNAEPKKEGESEEEGKDDAGSKYTWTGAVDYGKAMAMLERAGRLGHPQAMSMAGQLCHEGGAGLKIDAERAVSLYTEAAKLGDARAAYNLGTLYFNGVGAVTRDIDRAVTWWTRAHAMDPRFPHPNTILQSFSAQQRGQMTSAGAQQGGKGAEGMSDAEKQQILQMQYQQQQAAAARKGAAQSGNDFPIGAVLPLLSAAAIWALAIFGPTAGEV